VIRAYFEPQNVPAIEYKLEVTLSLGKWNEICDDLDRGNNKSASYPLREAIRMMTDQANRNFSPRVEG
jgi:hypothetical protein